MATFEVDVDVSDILSELSSREKREMYEDLKEELNLQFEGGDFPRGRMAT